MIIKDAYVFTETAQFIRKDIYIAGQYITDSSTEGDVLDATDLYAIPGLIDVHFHGCMGHDFSDGTPEALEAITTYQAAHGVTSICPATMTLPKEDLLKACTVGAAFEPEENQSNLIGIHLEGPFLSADKLGAQNPEYIHTADVAMYRELQEASEDLVRIVSIAPETEGAMDFIQKVSDEVSCSLAHTVATYDIAKEAFDKGANHTTHLYNAMPPFHHREPGVIGAAFDSEHCFVEMISDGVHLHPAVVRATLAMFGEDRVVLVSDSMEATGLEDGIYNLGGQQVQVTGNRATLVEGGNLAGSATNLMDCLRVAVQQMDIPLETAVRCATMNAAQSIGEYDTYGSITPGKVADIVLVDEELNIHQIILRGTPLLP